MGSFAQNSGDRVFRFAPSPNGYLHLGHAYSALLNHGLAQSCGGRFLLRIEDIDLLRARPAFEAAIYEDLAWLGLAWETPVRRQSEHFGDYRKPGAALCAGLLYPCDCSRAKIAEDAGRGAPRDPDGAPLYPGTCRSKPRPAFDAALNGGSALRLDMAKAAAGLRLSWREEGLERFPLEWNYSSDEKSLQSQNDGACSYRKSASIFAEHALGEIDAAPQAWGDVVIARKDTPTSYHLAVVVDDALQGVTDVVRGKDLFYATSVHRLLQSLLGLAAPSYRHHELLLGADGEKLSKSRVSKSLRDLRAEGVTAAQARELAAHRALRPSAR